MASFNYSQIFGSGSSIQTLANTPLQLTEDLEPYCVSVSLAGRTAYTSGRYPYDNRDLPYWFTEEKIIAPYNATLNDFDAVIAEGKWWKIDLTRDTIPDYSGSNIREEVAVLNKYSFPTATGSLCYSRMDASNGASGYNSRSTTPIAAANRADISGYSYSPNLIIERIYFGSKFYRVRVYKNGNLIDTIVTLGCWHEQSGQMIKPSFILGGFSADQCPPNTCSVDCGTYVCCYGSDGISVFNYNK